MRNDLHIILHWLEEEVTAERRKVYEDLDEPERGLACRNMLRKNAMALGMRRQDVEQLDGEAVLAHAMKLYQKYQHYIDRMERNA